MIFGAIGQYALGQDADDGVASGATVSAITSVLAGAATGAANAAGDIVAVAAVLVAGGASATNADGNAPGDTIVVEIEIIPGAATGTGAGEIGFWGPPARPYLPPMPVHRGNAVALGATLDVGVALVAGTAFGIDGEMVVLGEILELDLAA